MTAEDVTVVGGTVEERGVSEVVTCSVAAVVGVKTGAVVDRSVVEGVAPLVVAVDAVGVVEGSDDVVAIVVVAGVGVVLLDRVTYEKGVGVGGRKTPSGYG